METRRGGVFPAYPKWWISWVGCHPASRHQPTSNSSSSPSGNIVAEAIWDHGSSAASGSNTALMMSVMMASGYCCCCCSIFFRRYYDEMAPLWKISCLLSSLSSFFTILFCSFLYSNFSDDCLLYTTQVCGVSFVPVNRWLVGSLHHDWQLRKPIASHQTSVSVSFTPPPLDPVAAQTTYLAATEGNSSSSLQFDQKSRVLGG